MHAHRYEIPAHEWNDVARKNDIIKLSGIAYTPIILARL